MTTSGTSAFNLDLTEIVEEAFERNGSELRTGYDLKTARRSLNLLFADWANRGINMWTFEQGSQVLTPGVATYELPADTVDLLEHVIRTGAGSAFFLSHHCHEAGVHFRSHSVTTFFEFAALVRVGKVFAHGLWDAYLLRKCRAVGHSVHEVVLFLAS